MHFAGTSPAAGAHAFSTPQVGAFAIFSSAYAPSGQRAHTHTRGARRIVFPNLAFALPTPWAPRPRQLHHRALCGEGPGRAALYMGSVCARLLRCALLRTARGVGGLSDPG